MWIIREQMPDDGKLVKVRLDQSGVSFCIIERKGYSEQVFAHDNLMRAFKQDTVVVTVPPYVESIEYVEPKVDMTNKDTVLQYRNREMAALGISFLNSDGTQTVSTANISLNQLLKRCRESRSLSLWIRAVPAIVPNAMPIPKKRKKCSVGRPSLRLRICVPIAGDGSI